MHSTYAILAEDADTAGPDLVSLDDLKLALGITGSANDAELQAAITFQSRIIAEYCDRRFGRAEVLETFTFDRYECLRERTALTLWLYPVVEVLDISAAAEYELDPATGRLWLDGYSGGPLAVTYSGGYDLPEEAPARLARAVTEAVSLGRSYAVRDPAIQEVQHGDTRISYFSSSSASGSAGFLSAPVIDLIRPFRRLHAA